MNHSESTTAPLCSVIVVSYNTIDKLRRCLGCLPEAVEVIVVDNASGDGSAQMVSSEFPKARLIANQENLGFGAANNLGIDQATSDLVLLLNSDCYAEPGAIEGLVSFLRQNPTYVAVGGRLLNPDGSYQQSVAGPLTLWSVFLEQSLLDKLLRGHGYWRTPSASTGVYPCEQLMGACILMRKGERFDERFFLYVEDTDLCLRLRRHGKLGFLADYHFIHELGSSSKPNPWVGIARYNAAKELFFRIHFGSAAGALCLILDRAGALLRMVLGAIRMGPQARIFWKVLTAPIIGPPRF